MSGLLEHFKPPPLASDPPAKTKFWPAPPTLSSGGILQRPKTNKSASSSSTQLSDPSNPTTPCSQPSSVRVSFAPLPAVAGRKRRNSITLGVAARSAVLRQMKERSANGLPVQPGARPQPDRIQSTGSLGKPQYIYADQAGQSRSRRPTDKDDDVVDLGEVAMDAGRKLWWALSKRQRRPSAISDSGASDPGQVLSVGGLTVGASGHNTEREISVRGFAVPEEIVDKEEAGHVHRTEDYVAQTQALRIGRGPDSGEISAADPSAVSSESSEQVNNLSTVTIHATEHSPPPPTPQSEMGELPSSDTSYTSSNVVVPHSAPRLVDACVCDARCSDVRCRMDF